MQHEDAEQAALFEWAAFFPVLRWMHSIPNGAYLAGDKVKRARQMARLKKQGLKPGVSDIFLPLPMDPYHGLYIEMKKDKIHGYSKPTKEQIDFQNAMFAAGYRCEICYGATEAIAVIKNYAKI